MTLKKTVLTLALAIPATLFASLANAEGPGGGLNVLFAPPPDLASFDTNGDGRISTAELTAARTADFTSIDTDANGFGTLAELRTWFATKVDKQFGALDTDGNGLLSATEFSINFKGRDLQMVNNLFKAGDSDADGSLSKDEFVALGNLMINPMLPFITMDRDGDGQVSLAEYTSSPLGHPRPLPGTQVPRDKGKGKAGQTGSQQKPSQPSGGHR